jgi:cytochrome c oxidase subunit 4
MRNDWVFVHPITRSSTTDIGGLMSASTHAEGTVRVFMIVWFWLLALTAVEVFLGYKQLELKLMLALLLGLSVVKAALIIAYFMHLRYERASMAAILMPALIMVIVLMNIFLPDSLRLLHMRPH